MSGVPITVVTTAQVVDRLANILTQLSCSPSEAFERHWHQGDWSEEHLLGQLQHTLWLASASPYPFNTHCEDCFGVGDTPIDEDLVMVALDRAASAATALQVRPNVAIEGRRDGITGYDAALSELRTALAFLGVETTDTYWAGTVDEP
ncbi:hypothetical protein V6N00_13945 [Tersicoccus sp. MR15.9]|uniref:hypothetical protein n=1 Tax=Tersicoccus mangrovi TaxID=3121635 RepID=UPI002FE54F83